MNYQVQATSLEINVGNVTNWITDFRNNIQATRIDLGNYYDGDNEITKQGAVKNRPNYQVNVNMAKYITDVATGYTFGKPVTYTTDNSNIEKTLDKLLYINKNSKTADVDFEVGGDMSCYGVGYQLVMVKEGTEPIEDRIITKRLDPETTFFVVDNTILNNPVCAVYFYEYKTKDGTKIKVYVYDNEILRIFDGSYDEIKLESEAPHNMGAIPIIQTLNNDDAFGDYQQIKGLLDALSLAMSNNTDNLQSIANALLAVSGGILNAEQVKEINQEKIINLPIGAKVEWIIKNINPDAEKMQFDNILKFIFQIAQVPDLTDDAFAGNQSGVAMQYKLWGMNQLWATKVREYTETIYSRIKIFMHLLQYQITTSVQLTDDIQLTFTKNLPTQKGEEFEMVKYLRGLVSDKFLLQHITGVDDVDAEMEQIKLERQENADSYGFNNNEALNE